MTDKDKDEIIAGLKGIFERMNNISIIQRRANELGCDYDWAALQKDIEDGILKNLHQASPEQQDKLVRGYDWKFYIEYNQWKKDIEKGKDIGFKSI